MARQASTPHAKIRFLSARFSTSSHPASHANPAMTTGIGADAADLPLTQPPTAALLARGTCRALDQLGYASVLEFPLANGRRADILALCRAGDLAIVEIKTSVADFRADRKWIKYRDFADRFYFAVPSSFPVA